MALGGYLGGHLVFSRRVGVDVEVPIVDLRIYRTVGRIDDFVDGVPRRVEVDGVPIVVVRTGETVHALAAVCSHAGGPLDEGRVEAGVVQCPWHGSEFSLADGSVRRGPATAPQPRYAARVRDDFVEVRGPLDHEAIERVRPDLATSG
jgi:nitrite reductase/ring-hydroxylating ferredoxin subunit